MLQKYLGKKDISAYLFGGGVLVLFLFLRIFAWRNTVLFEDLDSLGYLETVKIILHADLEGIINQNADRTAGYPIFGALFSLPGWGVEIGARLTSLFFSGLVLVALLGIGKHIGRPWGVALGLFLISISPPLISHSFAVLSEPTYVGLLYLGLWLFWRQCKDPGVGSAVLLGITFGFAFLTRSEGILYLLFIPFLQGVFTYWTGRNSRSLKYLVSWSLIYVLCFGAIAVPQIWRVSEKMGTLAINGRQAWMAVLNYPDGKSYQEKLWGLDFDPAELNVGYLRAHPEDLPPVDKIQNFYIQVRKAIWLFADLNQKQLGILIGPLCLMAFGLGLLSLYKSGHTFELFLILAFLALSLVGPLMHSVRIRNILVIAPMMFLVAGIGIVYAGEAFVGKSKKYSIAQYVLPVLFLFGTVAVWAKPIKQVLKPADYNKEYSLVELREPLRILESVAENELGRAPIVLDGRYLTYFLGGTRLSLPYTNYQGLVKYCELNDVEFFYFNHRRIRLWNFPFLEDFTSGRALADFVLLYTGVDAYGEKVELYRFRNSKT